jgi:glycosyltransferase involved in cell wall biosynthesis
MKILHVIPSFGLGGMEKIICSIINHSFSQYKHIILSLDGNNRAFQWIKSSNVESLDFQKDESFSQYLKNLYKAINNASPDLLMTYNWGATDAIWLGRLVGIKNIIHHEHGFSIEEAKRTIWKRDICRFIVYRMVSALVTVSTNLRTSLQKKYWLSNNRVLLIPNGIDSDYYSPDNAMRQEMRKDLQFDDDDLVIVFSGRLDPVKNFELLLDVFERCHQVDPKVKLLIVGDGPERRKIEQLSRQKNIHIGLVMAGQRVEVLPYLRAGDVFLLTSHTEQMPLTILEAMAVGLPVIASDVGEIHHIIADGKDGFLRPTGAGVEGFAAALLSLKDASVRQIMRHAARAKIILSFQETTMIRRYQTLLDTLLRDPRLS